MKYTLGSLFDGIGGFPLSASRYGIKALWASEIEPFPIKVTKIRFPDMKHLGDITKINGADIDPVDIITFGSPCQDLSVAGKRAGLAGERSGLFMEAVRIIKEMRNTYAGTNEPIRPRFAVWENVPGAFSSNKGEDFRAVLEELCRVKDETIIIPKPPKGKWSTVGTIMGNGYSVAWRILDAQFWGVPQRRRRIFLVADFGGQSAPEILFKRKGLSRHLEESGETREGTTTDVERSTPKTMLIRSGKEGGGKGPLIQDDKSATLSTLNIQTLFAPQILDMTHANDVIRECGQVVPTLQNRMGTGGNQVPLVHKTYCIQGNCIDRADTAGCNGKGWTEDVCYTLNTIDRPAVMAIEPGALSRGQGERVWDKCPTLRANMGDNQPCVVFNEETITSKTNASNPKPGDPCHTLGATGAGRTIVLNDQGGSQMDISNDVVGTLRAEMHGNIPAVTTYQKVSGPLMANTHPGSYTGQDAHSDMLVTPYAHSSFAQYKEGFGQLRASGGDLGGGSETLIKQHYSVRRLTPLECERLQGFPDGWTDIPGQTEASKEELEFWREVWLTWDKTQAEDPEKVKPRTDKSILKWLKNPVSDSAQYKALGNSVAVPCPEYVLEGISEVLKQG